MLTLGHFFIVIVRESSVFQGRKEVLETLEYRYVAPFLPDLWKGGDFGNLRVV